MGNKYLDEAFYSITLYLSKKLDPLQEAFVNEG